MAGGLAVGAGSNPASVGAQSNVSISANATGTHSAVYSAPCWFVNRPDALPWAPCCHEVTETYALCSAPCMIMLNMQVG